ncbi:MAG: transcription termination/antitermination protein NusG [Pseudomonadota bacterium]
MAKRWYILHIYSGFEQKVAAQLREQAEQAGLEGLFGDVLVPVETVTEVKRGKRVESERKLFPGYLLVNMDMTDASEQLVRSLPRVTGFLGGKKPSPISNAEAERIADQVRDGVERPKSAITFEVGEQIRVCDGPFASFNGHVEEIDEERMRLKVTVSIFGRSTPVDLDYAQVEKF